MMKLSPDSLNLLLSELNAEKNETKKEIDLRAASLRQE